MVSSSKEKLKQDFCFSLSM